MSEEMKMFIEFQQFKKMSASLAPKLPAPKPVPAPVPAFRTWAKPQTEQREDIDYKKIGRLAFMKAWIDPAEKLSVGNEWFFTMRHLIHLDPELLTIVGGLHNNMDGSKTYLSARVQIGSHYVNIHMYGAATFNYFNVTEFEIFVGPKGGASVKLKVVPRPSSMSSASSTCS